MNRNLLRPSYSSEEIRTGAYGTSVCDINDMRNIPSRIWWDYPIFLRNRVIIVVETTMKSSERTKNPCSDSQSNITKKITESSRLEEGCYFISVQQLSEILAHLLRLRNLLLTGSHVMKYHNHTIQSSVKDSSTSTIPCSSSSEIVDKIARRNKELDQECSICMDHCIEVVLPCSHEFCSKCASSWVNVHLHCPLCRIRISRKDAENEQWQLETWSEADVAENVEAVEMKLHTLCSRLENNNKRKSLHHMSFHRLFVDFLNLSCSTHESSSENAEMNVKQSKLTSSKRESSSE